MIDTKTAKKLILSKVGALLAPDGFRPKLLEQFFYLPKPFGRWIIHVGFIPHKSVDMDMTVHAAIRVNAVETLVNERRGSQVTARDAEKCATLGGDIGNLIDGRQKRWEITSLEDVGSVAASIYSDVQSVGWPFFERYSDMENLLGLLSSLDARDWWLSPGNIMRCNRAVALAFALGKSDEIDAVVQKCENLLSQKASSELPDFSTFVESLRSRMDKGELPKIG